MNKGVVYERFFFCVFFLITAAQVDAGVTSRGPVETTEVEDLVTGRKRFGSILTLPEVTVFHAFSCVWDAGFMFLERIFLSYQTGINTVNS